MLSVRKHRAPEGALRLIVNAPQRFSLRSQKAPSARRCIKTVGAKGLEEVQRKGQKAPSARRCIKTDCRDELIPVERLGQKAPSARRCIKTEEDSSCGSCDHGQKAPSARRCIKTELLLNLTMKLFVSESTERQKVH